jgi:uncharacterized protein
VIEVVDVHQHVGGAAALTGDAGAPTPAEEADARIAAMDRLGVQWAVIQPTQMYLRPAGMRDTENLNDSVAELHRLAPDRFRVAVGTVEPLAGDDGVNEVTRCIEQAGLHGMSWHHRFQGCYVDAPLMRPLLRRLDELDGVAIVHTNSESKLEASWRLARLAREFPRVEFVGHDAFFSFEESEAALDICERIPNILWDLGGPLAAWPAAWSMIESWVRKHGAHRLAFSADIGYGGWEPKRPALLDAILDSALTDEDKAAILGGNANRVFGRALAGRPGEPGGGHTGPGQ